MRGVRLPSSENSKAAPLRLFHADPSLRDRQRIIVGRSLRERDRVAERRVDDGRSGPDGLLVVPASAGLVRTA